MLLNNDKEISWSDQIMKNKIISFITWYCSEKLFWNVKVYEKTYSKTNIRACV